MYTVNKALISPEVQRNPRLSAVFSELAKYNTGERSTIGKSQDNISKIVLVVPVVVDNFKGYTVAANLSAEMGKKLDMDAKNERFKGYKQSFHTTEVKISSKTDSLLIEYSTRTSKMKNGAGLFKITRG